MAEKKSNKVTLSAALTPSVRHEIERRAKRIGKGPCELAALILEHWQMGYVFCDVCRIPHALDHLEHRPQGGDR